MRTRKLVRNRRNSLALGVCSGIADFFGWDVGVVRLAWVFLTLFGGSGILLYLLAALIMEVSADSVDTQ